MKSELKAHFFYVGTDIKIRESVCEILVFLAVFTVFIRVSDYFIHSYT